MFSCLHLIEYAVDSGARNLRRADGLDEFERQMWLKGR